MLLKVNKNQNKHDKTGKTNGINRHWLSYDNGAK